MADSKLTRLATFAEPTPLGKDGRRPIEAVIFEGGGTKGMTYAGCIERLEQHPGIFEHVKYYAGSSAGAQTAALFAAGYSGEDLKKIMSKAPWKKLLDGNEKCCGCCGGCGGCGSCGCCGCCGCGCFTGLHRLFTKQGYYKGDYLEKYLDDLLKEKLGQEKITFSQFHEKTGKTLRLGVCNIATRKFEFLDHVSAPDVAISHGCRASSSIPFVFVPKVIGDNHYIDGGVQGNLPATAFGLKHGIAFHLLPAAKYEEDMNSKAKVKTPPKTFWGFVETVVDMLINYPNPEAADGIEEAHHLDVGAKLKGEGMNIIRINTEHHGVLETSLTKEQINSMIQKGAEAADGFLESYTSVQSEF